MLRLLKPPITNPRIPLWDLMMKNVYSLGAFQVNARTSAWTCSTTTRYHGC
jgi:cell surface protein SprA